MKTRMLCVALVLAAAGCAGRTPPPDRVQAVVAVPPPAVRAENRGTRPRDGNWVWVPGYWNWSANRHVWVPGMWSVPPRGFRTWDPAHWMHTREGWVLVRGQWR
jgi:hypothetical protein